METLLKRVAQKDKGALTELYMQTKDSVFGFALFILKNVQDAEDVLQDTYLKVYMGAGGYCARGKPLAWMLTITRNLCYEKLRERKKRSDISEEDWENYLCETENVTAEDKMMLEACMRCLTDEEKQIVILHAVAGLKHREIATMLSMHLSTILSKYNRALKKMRNYIKEGEF